MRLERPAGSSADEICGENVLLLALATKVALDSQTVAYYSAAALFGALAYDLIGRRSALPVWTLFSYLALHSSMDVVANPSLRAEIRAGSAIVPVVVILGAAAKRSSPTKSRAT